MLRECSRSLEIAIQPWVHKGSLRAKAVSHGIIDSRLITRQHQNSWEMLATVVMRVGTSSRLERTEHVIGTIINIESWLESLPPFVSLYWSPDSSLPNYRDLI